MLRRSAGTPGVSGAAARACEICKGTATRSIRHQRFVLFDDRSGLDGYEVVACRACGFVYASDLPGQPVFDRYYRDLSKYESHDTGGAVAPWAATIHRSIVREISARLPDRNARILDVGAASGHLLATFRDAGFANVLGFDPSRRCSDLARQRYGVRVVNEPISQMALDGQRFDLILLASVLEHLRDLDVALSALHEILAPGGAIWFEVPDAERFPDYVRSPFHQFSLEHINFFTRTSLERLMGGHGFCMADSWKTTRVVGCVEDPGLDAFFIAGEPRREPQIDVAGPLAVDRYAKTCYGLERSICERIASFSEAGSPVTIWGTGSLTLHLMTLEPFRRLDVAAFVDANANYHGKTIAGVPVLAPSEMRGRPGAILVASHTSEGDIMAAIRGTYALPNAIVGLVSGRMLEAVSSVARC